MDAVTLASRMRILMDQDKDEFALAREVEDMNSDLNREQLLFEEAWALLASNERSAWKGYLNLRKEHGYRY